MKINKIVIYIAMIVLYFLHNDIWLWNDSHLILGLPIGLFYHILFCFAASLLMILLVVYAWPKYLDISNTKDSEQ